MWLSSKMHSPCLMSNTCGLSCHTSKSSAIWLESWRWAMRSSRCQSSWSFSPARSSLCNTMLLMLQRVLCLKMSCGLLADCAMSCVNWSADWSRFHDIRKPKSLGCNNYRRIAVGLPGQPMPRLLLAQLLMPRANTAIMANANTLRMMDKI